MTFELYVAIYVTLMLMLGEFPDGFRVDVRRSVTAWTTPALANNDPGLDPVDQRIAFSWFRRLSRIAATRQKMLGTYVSEMDREIAPSMRWHPPAGRTWLL